MIRERVGGHRGGRPGRIVPRSCRGQSGRRDKVGALLELRGGAGGDQIHMKLRNLGVIGAAGAAGRRPPRCPRSPEPLAEGQDPDRRRPAAVGWRGRQRCAHQNGVLLAVQQANAAGGVQGYTLARSSTPRTTRSTACTTRTRAPPTSTPSSPTGASSAWSGPSTPAWRARRSRSPTRPAWRSAAPPTPAST